MEPEPVPVVVASCSGTCDISEGPRGPSTPWLDAFRVSPSQTDCNVKKVHDSTLSAVRICLGVKRSQCTISSKVSIYMLLAKKVKSNAHSCDPLILLPQSLTPA